MTAPPPLPPASAMPLLGGLVLLVATGFVDAYTFLALGHVFAEAMTGNLVLVGIGVVDPAVVPFWRPLASFLAFCVGAGAAWAVGRGGRTRAPQLATLVVLVAVLAVAGFLPDSFPAPVVACGISFAAGLQIASFNRIGAARFTTIVMTSNSLAAVNASLGALASRRRDDALAAARLVAALAAFVGGVVLGAVLTEALGRPAAWVAAALFALAGGSYLARRPRRGRRVSSPRPSGGNPPAAEHGPP